MASVDKYYDQFTDDMSQESAVLTKAATELSPDELQSLKVRIGNKKAKVASKAGTKAPSTSGSFEVVNPEPASDAAVQVSQAVVAAFWKELEGSDPTTLISPDVLAAFKYVGFDPEIVARELLIKNKTAGRSMEEFKKDLVNMITIAIIKGSITERNLEKTSDDGKVLYEALKQRYGLKTGGTKGKGSEYLTIARVAAAFPGLVMQVLIKKPEFAKSFIGPFGSKTLPSYLRHQAAAACIPDDTPAKLKEFVLGLITAYTADQSKVLSKTKDGAETIYDDQLNYVMTTHASDHPSEAQRKKIFSNFSLSSDFEKLQIVGNKIKKVKPDFVVLSQQELDEELSKL